MSSTRSQLRPPDAEGPTLLGGPDDEAPPPPPPSAPPGRPPFWRRLDRRKLARWARWAAKAAVLGAALGVLLLTASFWWLSRDLPPFDTLEDYRPLQTTRVISADGKVVGELFQQRRTVVPFEALPQVLLQAVIAAEDEHFYEHEGLDYAGILRAAVKNLLALRVKEGASTITQQVVKTFLLTPERKFSRKIKEMILARRLEDNLSKDEILYLYLNQIYFGHGRYGVEEAARYYFGKPVHELGLAEAALLAGLPKGPAYYSPRRHPEAARTRRAYVLGRMVQAGFVPEDQAAKAREASIVLSPLPEPSPGAWYVEEVRRRLEIELGPELLLGGGLSIRIAMDAQLQAAAEAAVEQGLEAVDRRQGWRGALGHLAPERIEAARDRFAALIERRRAQGRPEAPIVWDLADLPDWDPAVKPEPPIHLVTLSENTLVAGLVARTDAKAGTAEVELGSARLQLRLKDLAWARPWDPARWTAPPKKITDVVAAGDVVRVRVTSFPADLVPPRAPGELPRVRGELHQIPQVEGALVAVAPESHEVRALVGGYDMRQSRFNRATQASRQPGSAFKPFVYGAALDSGRYTAVSRVLDAPAVFRDPWTNKAWKPENSGERFDGEMPLRSALAQSKNVVSARLVADLGVDTVIDFAHRAGIGSELPRYLPLALGAGEVKPLELVNAYATLAALGRYDTPVLILEVKDPTGRVLREHTPAPEQTIRPEVAYVVMDLMTSVMSEGTGRALNQLSRPVAAKTGTANEQKDAWFVGITPQLVAGAWVGFDTPRPLGPREYGARAAGPVWLEFMRSALEGQPPDWFDPPSTVTFARIDPESGLLAPPGAPGVYEPFVDGTEPTAAAPPGRISPDDFPFVESP